MCVIMIGIINIFNYWSYEWRLFPELQAKHSSTDNQSSCSCPTLYQSLWISSAQGSSFVSSHSYIRVFSRVMIEQLMPSLESIENLWNVLLVSNLITPIWSDDTASLILKLPWSPPGLPLGLVRCCGVCVGGVHIPPLGSLDLPPTVHSEIEKISSKPHLASMFITYTLRLFLVFLFALNFLEYLMETQLQLLGNDTSHGEVFTDTN